MNGKVLASYAVLPSSSVLSSQEMILPDMDFAKDWKGCIDHSFYSSDALDAFEKAMSACVQLSRIVGCRNLEVMNPVEQEVTDKIIDVFKNSRECLEAAATEKEFEELNWFLDKVDSSWNDLFIEYEAAKAGKTVPSPLYEGIYSAFLGQENERVKELGAMCMLLVQAEVCAAISEA